MRTLPFTWSAVAFVFAACSASPAAPRLPVAPTKAEHAAKPVNRSPAAINGSAREPADDVELVDLPPPLEVVETRKLELLRTLCPLAIRMIDGRHEVGCRTCFPEAMRSPDHRIALNPSEFYRPHHVVDGSFTVAGASEVAVSIEGCESHAENWGGLLLVRSGPGGRRVADYYSGVHPDSCKPHRRRDGRDILICVRRDGNQGTWHDFVFSFDFARAEGADSGQDTLAVTSDDTNSGCLSGGAPPEWLTQGAITGLTSRDVDGDGEKDLVVDVRHARARPGPAHAKYCRDLVEVLNSERPAQPPASQHLLGRPMKYTLTFIYDGARFNPTRATRALLSRLEWNPAVSALDE